MITDGDNRIISANQGVSRITGYSREEIIGQDPSILKSGKHDQHFYQQLWESLLTDGFWQGEIWNRRKNAEVYPEWLSITVVRDTQGKIVNYIAMFNDITEIKEREQQIEFLAHYDPLTQLANRFQLKTKMQHLLALASRNKILLAVLFLDLDRFKILNDSLGHSSGDAVLLIVADRLKNTLRDVDIVARLGGDEFVIVLPNLKEVSDAMFVARKLEEVVRKPMQIDGQMLTITSSIGISVYPENGEDYETLLKNADTAMYNAKRSGRDNFMFFSNHMNTDAKEQLTMDAALRLEKSGI